MTKRTVITGIGPISSIGIGKDAVWDNMLKGIPNVETITVGTSPESSISFLAHKINDFNLAQHGLDQSTISEVNAWNEGCEKDLDYIIAASKLAIDDSGIEKDDGLDFGIVLFHENLGQGSFFEKALNITSAVANAREAFSPETDIFFHTYKQLAKSGYNLQTFVPLFQVAKVLNVHGFSLMLNNACCSGLYALEAASDILQSGKCSAVCVAGSDSPNIFKYLWFKELGVYSAHGKINPFSTFGDGFLMGEGAAGLVLEDFENARRRGARIYAEYLGGGFVGEAWKINFPAVTKDYYSLAMRRAFKNAKVAESDIDFLCPHATGLKLFDRYEAEQIKIAYSDSFPELLVSAFKPYIGHTLGVSALLELLMAVLCMEHNMVPPTLNTEGFDSSLGVNIARDLVKRPIQNIMKICSSYAGYDAAVILHKV